MRSPGSLRLSLSALIAILAAPGCAFYADDDDDSDCPYGGVRPDPGGGADEPVAGLRNPETGECEYFGGGGGGGGCDDPCYPCAEPAETGAPQAQPSWGWCQSQCTGLDEASCKSASGCRAIYTSECIDQRCVDTPLYVECWSTDMTGPIQGGGCEGLDAYTCSMHDDCAAVHHSGCEGTGEGLQDAPCGAGGFGYCTAEGGSGTGPGTCEGEALCDIIEPNCPDGTTPGIGDSCYTGYCIPLDECGNPKPDPGLCYASVTCAEDAPDCPSGTTPGLNGGCYTGYCIPLVACEAAPTCAEIPAEATCIAREDCAPLYRGENCSCDPQACTCEDWIFDSCE